MFSPTHKFGTKRYLWFSSWQSIPSLPPNLLSNLLSLFLVFSKLSLRLSPSPPGCTFLLVWSQWTSFPVLKNKQANQPTQQPVLQLLPFIYRKKKKSKLRLDIYSHLFGHNIPGWHFSLIVHRVIIGCLLHVGSMEIMRHTTTICSPDARTKEKGYLMQVFSDVVKDHNHWLIEESV